jgi:hypothetical protein
VLPQTFYSFRHNFRDAYQTKFMKQIAYPGCDFLALDRSPQSTADTRGLEPSKLCGKSPDYQTKFMEQVAFPGLDLSHSHI